MKKGPPWGGRTGAMAELVRFMEETDGLSAPVPEGAGEIETAFFEHTGRIVHKWHHYLPIYDRYLAPYRGRQTPVRMLEIGVYLGGSIELWRKFFGAEATIYGIDINKQCAAFDGESGTIRIGSQDDPKFLAGVIAEMGGVDVIVDDGSHKASHQRTSFDTLFPLLNEGGIYIVEDLHTAYWSDYEGGYLSPGSFVSRCKTMIDDIHHNYHDQGQLITASRNAVAAMHIYDSVAVFEKRAVPAPLQSKRGAVAS